MSETDERRAVLDALSAGTGRFPGAVARSTGMSAQKATRILKDLVKSGAVRTAVTGEGRITYSLA